MSTGRHARKRAAQEQERLAGEQQRLLEEEQAKEKEKRKDIESQRISTMRSRFGGQSPDVVGDAGSIQRESVNDIKGKTPNRIKNRDPMQNTLMSMFLDNQVDNGQ